MFTRSKNFVVQKNSKLAKNTELVGQVASDLNKLVTKKIEVTDYAVVTTECFDDFLVANNLVEKVLAEIEKVRPFQKDAAQLASNKIKQLILSSEIPSHLWDEIKLGIENVGKLNNSTIFRARSSNIVDREFVPEGQKFLAIENIIGEQAMKSSIKQLWAHMFSTEAIEERVNKYYDGPLSMAVVVEKLPKLEMSGKYYSLVDRDNPDEIIVKAVYGLVNFGGNEQEFNKMADEYRVSVQKEIKILEKNVRVQNSMFVFQNQHGDAKTLSKVDISEEWQGKQKLRDDMIIQIVEQGMNVEKVWGVPVEIEWGIEAGKVIVLSVKSIDEKRLLQNNSSNEGGKKSEKKNKLSKKESKNNSVDNNDKKKKVKASAEDKGASTAASITQSVKEDKDLDKSRKTLGTIHTQLLKAMGGENVSEEIAKRSKDKENNGEENKKNSNRISISKLKRTISLLPLNRNMHPDAELIDEKIVLDTDNFLDVTSLTANKIKSAKHFSGVFLDGTVLVTHHGELPEQHINNAYEYTKLVEAYLLDIKTLKNSIESKRIIYQFSTITEKELSEMKIKSIDNFYGDERFIAHPESLVAEAISIKRAKRDEDKIKIDLVFPSVRNVANLEDMKTIVESQGIIRSNATKLYAEVAIPSFAIDLRNIGEDVIDGLIIDYDTLLALTVYRTDARDVDHEMLFGVIRNIVDIARIKKLEIIVRLHGVEEKIIKKIISLRVDGIVFSSIPQRKTLSYIQSLEKGITKIK